MTFVQGDYSRISTGNLWRSWLYVPGDQKALIAKALDAQADCVIIDLEDAVPVANKEVARINACETVREHQGAAIVVRVNAVGSPWHEKDLAALSESQVKAVRIPKSQTPEQIARIGQTLGSDCELHLLIESARGLQASDHLAQASPTVRSIALGEADLRADLGITEDEYLGYARGRIVASARAASLVPPPQSVYTNVKDDQGLLETSRQARAAGFFGRAVIHPRQVEIVNSVFTPTHFEVSRAQEVVNSLAQSESAAALVLSDGRFVDPAIVAGAQRVLDLAELYGTTQEETGV